MSDFDTGLIAAVKNTFGNRTVRKGCDFISTKTTYKNIEMVSRATVYQKMTFLCNVPRKISRENIIREQFLCSCVMCNLSMNRLNVRPIKT